MFKLTEDFKYEYSQYLISETKKELSEAFEQIEEAQSNMVENLRLLEEYYTNFAKTESLTEAISSEDIQALTVKMMNMLTPGLNTMEADRKDYTPVQGVKFIETIKDMKFPKNIIFFIKQLWLWIKDVVVYWLGKIKNIFGYLVGIKPNNLKTEIKSLKERLQKEKFTELKPEGWVNPSGKTSTVRVLRTTSDKDVDILQENTDVKFKPDNRSIVVSLDITRDLDSLEQLLDHFLDLFDNSYGSNNEKLYGIDDLELLLSIFDKTVRELEPGNKKSSGTRLVVSGELTEIAAIDTEKTYENLIRTKNNLDNLRKAFSETQSKIRDIARIVGHKQLLLASDLTGGYKFYSVESYSRMERILSVIEARMNSAVNMERDLKSIEGKYSKILDKLNKMAQQFNAVSGIQYITSYQRSIASLLKASKYMTQTVSIRLASLGMYIRELTEVYDLIDNLNAMNSRKDSIKDKAMVFIGRLQR